MTSGEAAVLLGEIAAAYPAMQMPPATASVWRSWLEALPYDVGRQAVLTLCASEDWPRVSDLVKACGIGSEQVKAMLVAAKEGGFEVVKDDRAPLGWRTSRDALPEPTEQHGEPVPCPPELAEEIKRRIGTIAGAKAVATTPSEAAARAPR